MYKRLSGAFIGFVSVFLIGVLGYKIIEGWTLFDSFYMTVITLATVGYSETHPLSVSGRMFTIFLILGGMGVLVYFVSTITAFILEGELKDVIRRQRMEKSIKKLSNHYVICGTGRIGGYIVDELLATKRDFVVIEKNQEKVRSLYDKGCMVVEGDATQDQVIQNAGIGRAKGLFCCLGSDQDNLFVIIGAKQYNQNLRIVSRSIERGTKDKLIRSGANVVVSPNFIGGLRMASEMVRPAVTSFLDIMLRKGDGVLRIEEVVVEKNSHGIGKSINDVISDEKHGLLLALQHKRSGEYIFNPSRDVKLEEEDILVLMGKVDQINNLRGGLA